MDDQLKFRLTVFIAVLLGVILLLGMRLVQLQIVEHDVYTLQSEGSSVARIVKVPARGLVLDRYGELIVDNEPTYSITLTPFYFDESKTHDLATLLGVPDSTVTNRLREAAEWSPYQPSVSFRAVTVEVFSLVQEHIYNLPGVDYLVEQKRRHHGPRAAHLLGYIKEISREQLDEMASKGYRQGDQVGQAGIERYYEEEMRGRPGVAYMDKNVHGQLVSSHQSGKNDTPPISGHSFDLSIDAQLQLIAEQLFENKRGGAVAIDPQNGEVLALVSGPDYNPELFSGTVHPLVWQGLNSDPDKPLFNRATKSHQPPGSTFKPFMALFSLAEGNIDETSRVHCAGGFGQHRCMGVHGGLTVRDAIKFSCNTFFYTMMYRANFAHWNDFAHTFGFGVIPPIDISEKNAGIIPDSAHVIRLNYPDYWKNKKNAPVIYGIGQGITTTPLQMARYVAAIANGGTLYTPHLVRTLINPVTGDTLLPKLADAINLDIDPHNFDLVREGMRRMAMERTSNVRWGDIVMAGKTGTAQVGRRGWKDHSWFIGFAPFDNPRIAVAVLVENAGYGATAAAPIAGLMMQQYLEGEILAPSLGRLEYISKGVRSQGFDGSIDWTLSEEELKPILEAREENRRRSLRSQTQEPGVTLVREGRSP